MEPPTVRALETSRHFELVAPMQANSWLQESWQPNHALRHRCKARGMRLLDVCPVLLRALLRGPRLPALLQCTRLVDCLALLLPGLDLLPELVILAHLVEINGSSFFGVWGPLGRATFTPK